MNKECDGKGAGNIESGRWSTNNNDSKDYWTDDKCDGYEHIDRYKNTGSVGMEKKDNCNESKDSDNEEIGREE